MAAPKTLREKLMNDREQLYEIKSVLLNAINELLSGAAVVSYSVLNRSATHTRADLNSMRESLASIEAQINEIEAVLSGRSPRNVSTYSYLAPSNTFWGGFV